MEHKFIIDNKIDVAGLRKNLFGLKPKERMKFLFGLGPEFLEIKKRTSELFIDERDYMVYSIVKIGNQYWFGENMLYEVKGSVVNPDSPSPEYGRLYNHEQAIKSIPFGWHLPSDQEWNELEMFYGTDKEEVLAMGERGVAAYALSSPEWIGKNSGLFNALPAGYYSTWKDGAAFAGLGTHASYLSDTVSDSKSVWGRHWGGCMDMVGRYDVWRKTTYRACRAIKNG
ncbi:MAG: hypothetical protein K0S33_79 [Bacteroidetes bacterium]|jgi:uncharacterized protein (TIGR02145 family)|nr:hypothetical protein [Bacteroidota bacterium]